MSTDDAHLAAAVARVWPDGVDAWEPLGGGITNHNVKVVRGEETLVLRVAGKDTDLLGIDRGMELEATRAAAAIGVGPEVVDFVEPEGWLVTRFVEGRTPPPAEMSSPRALDDVAATLRQVHTMPVISGRFDTLAIADAYRETVRERGGAIPERFDWARTLAVRITERRSGAPLVPCHNDLLNANFLCDGTRLRIVDWEYAGMGDPFFDLANFAINHELDADGRERLLAAYLGAPTDADRQVLELMRFMSDFREAMWGVVQGAVSQLDFDFGTYAADHFSRMERTAAEPAFRAVLDA